MNTVYKYCDQYGVDILRNLELKITPPNQFDDPFEFTPHCICSDSQGKAMSLITSDVRVLLENKFQSEKAAGKFSGTFEEFVNRFVESHLSPAIPRTMQEFQRRCLDNMSAHFGVLCLSERRNSIAMWGHYADKHQGLVIGLTRESWLRPVDYVTERVAVDTCWNEGGEEEKTAWVNLAFSKNKEWVYQDEIRGLFKLDDGLKRKPVIDKRTGKEALGYFLPLPSKAVISVSLGWMCPPELEHEVKLALQDPRLAHVLLDRAELHESKFDLTFQ